MGSFDWIADFAGKLPMDVISEMMGVPEEDRAEVRRQADIVVHREDGMYDVPPAGDRGRRCGWSATTRRMVDQRRKQPSDDLTSALIEAELDGERLSDEDVIAFLFLMVVAGNETTTKLLGHALFHLTRHPDQLETVVGGPATARSSWCRWVEETLRFDTSSQLLARYLLRDVELHGTVAPQGSKLLLCLGSANRDERVFSRPDRLRHLPRQGRARADPVLRRRPALLPGRQPGPARGAGRADRAGASGSGRSRSTTTRAVRVHSVNVRGFARVPTRVEAR